MKADFNLSIILTIFVPRVLSPKARSQVKPLDHNITKFKSFTTLGIITFVLAIGFGVFHFLLGRSWRTSTGSDSMHLVHPQFRQALKLHTLVEASCCILKHSLKFEWCFLWFFTLEHRYVNLGILRFINWKDTKFFDCSYDILLATSKDSTTETRNGNPKYCQKKQWFIVVKTEIMLMLDHKELQT